MDSRVPSHSDQVNEIFAPSGPLAQHLKGGYHAREGQIRMAQLVAQALDERRHAVLEAGTGVGKSFAYLVPLISQSKSAIVSTANKTLQDQLINYDLPTLKRAFHANSLRFSSLKGHANYICRLKWHDRRQQFSFADDGEALLKLEEDLRPSGVSGDLDHLTEGHRWRGVLTVSRDECFDNRCEHYKSCFYEIARKEATAAQVVVVNHAVLARLILAGDPLVTHRAIVVDEAHELAAYMVGALAMELSLERFDGVLKNKWIEQAATDRFLQEVLLLRDSLFAQLSSELSRVDAYRVLLDGPELLDAGLDLARRLRELNARLDTHLAKPGVQRPELQAGQDLAHRMAGRLAGDATRIFGSEIPGTVRYIEAMPEPRSQLEVLAKLQPLFVDEVLSERLFAKVDTVIATSATLAIRRSFEFFRGETGLSPRLFPNVIQDTFPSPYDYSKRTLFYIPAHLTPPAPTDTDKSLSELNQRHYIRKLADEMQQLIECSPYRVLILSTSRNRMGELCAALRERLPIKIYLQGEDSLANLIRRFRADERAVLIGTRSLWSGIDVADGTLSLVIIDHLPFEVPTDPVLLSQASELRRERLDPFDELFLPRAIIALKQAVGRLIRSERDRGVVAVLDSRLLQKKYGRVMQGSLRLMAPTTDLDTVQRFQQRLPPFTDLDAARSGADRYELDFALPDRGAHLVYRATDRNTGERVAVKVLSLPRQVSAEAFENCRQERARLDACREKHLVKILDLWRDEERLTIVMAYVPGARNLTEMTHHTQLSPVAVAEMGHAICEALASAHEMDVVHGDIRPTWVLVAPDGSVKVSGFGLAHISGYSAISGLPAGSSATDPTQLIYRAPECVATSTTGDARSDLYAAAAIMYEALRGETHLDFRGCMTLDDFRRAIIHQKTRPLIIRNTPFNRQLTAVIMRALENDPSRRFRSAASMRLALRDSLKLLRPVDDLE